MTERRAGKSKLVYDKATRTIVAKRIGEAMTAPVEPTDARVRAVVEAAREFLNAEWMVTHDWGGDRAAVRSKLEAALSALDTPATSPAKPESAPARSCPFCDGSGRVPAYGGTTSHCTACGGTGAKSAHRTPPVADADRAARELWLQIYRVNFYCEGEKMIATYGATRYAEGEAAGAAREREECAVEAARWVSGGYAADKIRARTSP